LQVSIVRLVEATRVVLKPHGQERIGRCVFHDGKTELREGLQAQVVVGSAFVLIE